MNSITLRSAIFYLYIFTLSVAFLPVQAQAEDGFWSANSETLGAYNVTEATLQSPGGKAELIYKNYTLLLTTFSHHKVDLTKFVSTPNLVEAGWSRDSRAVFINTSDGGSIGTWSIHAYVIEKNGVLEELPVAASVGSVSKLTSSCTFKNLSAVTWLDGHKKLLLIEQIPDTSNCSNMGDSSGYIYDTSINRVTAKLSKSELKKGFWDYLGPQGRGAVEY